MLAICADYADRVPAYDAEACAIEFVIRLKPTDYELSLTAKEALRLRDEPLLEETRYEAILELGLKPEEVQERVRRASEFYRAQLSDDVDPIEWLRRAQVLFLWSRDVLFLAEAEERVQPYLERWVAADPYNSLALPKLIRVLRFMQTRDRDSELQRRLWLQAMVHGRRHAGLWELGAEVMPVWPDLAATWIYYENAFALSADPTYGLGSLLADLDRTEAMAQQMSPAEAEAARTGLASLDCLRARAARLLHAACREWSAQRPPHCQLGNPRYDPVGPILAKLERGEICPELATVPLDALAFDSLTPVPELEAFLATVEPGFSE